MTTRLVDRFEKTYILFESAILTYLPIAWLKKSSTFQRLLEEKCLYKVQAASLTDFQGPGGKEKRKEKHSTHFFAVYEDWLCWLLLLKLAILCLSSYHIVVFWAWKPFNGEIFMSSQVFSEHLSCPGKMSDCKYPCCCTFCSKQRMFLMTHFCQYPPISNLSPRFLCCLYHPHPLSLVAEELLYPFQEFH